MNQKRGNKTPSPTKTTPRNRKTPIKHAKKGKNVDRPSQSETPTSKVKSVRTPKKVKSSSTPKSRKSSPRKKLSVQKSEKNRMLELALFSEEKVPETNSDNTNEMETGGYKGGSAEDGMVKDTLDELDNSMGFSDWREIPRTSYNHNFTSGDSGGFTDSPEIPRTSHDHSFRSADSLSYRSSGSSTSFHYPLTPPFGSPVQSNQTSPLGPIPGTPFQHYQLEGSPYSSPFLQPSMYRSVTWPPPPQVHVRLSCT